MQLIDTADSYGPHVSEEIIREAIHSYLDEALIATKVGQTRSGPDTIRTRDGLVRLGLGAWPPVGRPQYLCEQTLMSLRRLGLDHIDRERPVPGHRRPDRARVPDRGDRHCPDATTLTGRSSADVLDPCTHHRIGFMPVAAGELARPGGRSTGSRPPTAPGRPGWHWPGCSPAPRSCCPPPAPPRSRTFRRTWPRQRCA
ncbi:aldo/keto reductase [Streptomyces griseofuscus]|uniref:aldo/keto reductase n=1 Tax=Streptomyces griseofuscus TaxID=146922 RepID=UPI001FADF55F|nr:aldo/keto reductase [Streptomyces griseofuscus]